MVIRFMRIVGRSDFLNRFDYHETHQVVLIWAVVLFASLGLGEGVYRLAFSDFYGSRDRLPLEVLFGSLLSCFAIKLIR
jgi:hypothetical protein